MTRVFISSVQRDLEDIRKELAEHLRTAGFDVSGMENFGARSHRSLEVCLSELRKADVVVLIVGPRYGSLLPDEPLLPVGISYTHAEFREARDAGIPVLAFVLPDVPELPEEEGEHLSSFKAEVGTSLTYQKVSETSKLPAAVLTSLIAASRSGSLGGRYAPFKTFDHFFFSELGDTAGRFNHNGALIGRSTELEEIVSFLKQDSGVIMLKAPGGTGKSRLLLEAARLASGRSGMPHVRFLGPGDQWSGDDVNSLPTEPLVLVVDDAHRRWDLAAVIRACLQHNPSTRFIVSCRPSAVDVVKPHISNLPAAGEVTELELPRLSEEESIQLARYHLSAAFDSHASRLVKVADRNPLVIVVGGRCIAEKRVLPDVLERTPEVFRRLVLDRLLDDPALDKDDAETRRDVLQVIAAIGPVSTEHEELITSLSKRARIAKHKVKGLLSTLEGAGFLRRRGRLVRISPDVLGDHLLYQAAVDHNGKPTGFVEEMVELFSQAYLEQILANAAELDWRATATATHTPVLTRVWDDLCASIPDLTMPKREKLLRQLKRPAQYAPEHVFAIAESIADTRDAPADEVMQAWGLDDTYNRLVDPLTEMFAFLAPHPDFTDRCLQRLWDFASVDSRPTNPNPSHPRRRLEDLLKYDQALDWHSQGSVQFATLKFVVGKLRDPERTEMATWAIKLMSPVLQRFGEANQATARSVTFGQFSLSSYYDLIAERRHLVLDTLQNLAMGARAEEAGAAVNEIDDLLRLPRASYGGSLTPEQVAVWEPEARQAISMLVDIAKRAPLKPVRYLARRALRQGQGKHWESIAPDIEAALENTTPLSTELLYDLLVGLPWSERRETYEEEQDFIAGLCRKAAKQLWNESRSAADSVSRVLEGQAALGDLLEHVESHAGRLVAEIISAHPDQRVEAIGALIEAGESSWGLLRPSLLQIHEDDPAAAVALVGELAESEAELLRAHAIDPLQWMTSEATEAERLDICARFARDKSAIVRRTVAQALQGLRRSKSMPRVIETLLSIEWGSDLSIANSVVRVLHPRFGIDPATLTDEQIDILLERAASGGSFEGHPYELFEFIAYASTRRPRQTIEMLLQRIRSSEHRERVDGERRWTPLPYNAHGLSLPGVATAPDSVELLRLVRDARIDLVDSARFWLPQLFGAASAEREAALQVLREWLASGDAEKVAGAIDLLGAHEHSFVFAEHEFVAEAIEAASACSPAALERVSGRLFGIAIGGVHSSAPGEPAPRDVQNKEKAHHFAEVYSDRPHVKAFYESIVRHSEHSMERDRIMWEEEADD